MVWFIFLIKKYTVVFRKNTKFKNWRRTRLERTFELTRCQLFRDEAKSVVIGKVIFHKTVDFSLALIVLIGKASNVFVFITNVSSKFTHIHVTKSRPIFYYYSTVYSVPASRPKRSIEISVTSIKVPAFFFSR